VRAHVGTRSVGHDHGRAGMVMERMMSRLASRWARLRLMSRSWWAGWIGQLDSTASHALGRSGAGLAVTVAIISVLVGLGPLLFRRYSAFLIAGVALSLDFWVFGQAFGQIATGIGTDPNTAPLVILLALAISPAMRTVRAGRPAAAPVPTGPLVPRVSVTG
jgi:hypothetical protein